MDFEHESTERLLLRTLTVAALLAVALASVGCGGGGDEEAEAEVPKSALLPGALDDTLRTTADTSSWYQVGGTETGQAGMSSSTRDGVVRETDPADQGAQATTTQSGPNSSSVAKKPEGDYILQLGSFRDQDNARRQADRLVALGHRPSIEVSDLGGQTYHRVVLLGLPDRSAASALGERIHAELGITYLVRLAR